MKKDLLIERLIEEPKAFSKKKNVFLKKVVRITACRFALE